ncbi:M48 family metallopeptidase [Succinivibrio dextrinosolvens]|uniref:M48 family metallopeptidase n=1 Tax=Succinivibrio dextrinosolvens TaxID=83771 RepID=UPI00247A4142|nr:M48 family metallopeptidase [Succinivibrio dextrinosolvens]
MKYTNLIASALVGCALLSSCAQTTKSMFGDDRNQFMLVSEQTINTQSAEEYKKVIADAKSKNKLDTTSNYSKRVNSISKKLIKVAPSLREDCRSWQWEVNTIKDNTVNAWCMPGGKIVVYTGLIKELSLTDDEMAAIIGHEISHALKEHSREAMSKAMVQSGVTSVAGLFGVSSTITDSANAVYNATVALPFSRDQESEADKYGLELMYKAGFNPQGAVSVMKKMDAYEKKVTAASGAAGNSKATSLLNSITSTHPTSEKRYKDLQALIDKYGLKSEI